MKPIHIACLVTALLTLAACSSSHTPAEETAPTVTTARIGMANPASVHCEKLGGTLAIHTDKDGGQYGMCSLPDGRICEEWALFRDGQCKTDTQGEPRR